MLFCTFIISIFCNVLMDYVHKFTIQHYTSSNRHLKGLLSFQFMAQNNSKDYKEPSSVQEYHKNMKQDIKDPLLRQNTF